MTDEDLQQYNISPMNDGELLPLGTCEHVLVRPSSARAAIAEQPARPLQHKYLLVDVFVEPCAPSAASC